MAEKRGQLEKMVYDFPTEAVLEVCIKGNWYRTTSREFRSFDGPRRYTKPVKQPGHGIEGFKNIEFETVQYTGPVYMFGSNKEVYPQGLEQIVSSSFLERTTEISRNR